MDLDFELARGFVSDGRVFAACGVVALDIFEDFGAGVTGVLKASVLEQFEFESPNERLGPGVVIRVGAR
ncbi:MAG: hypothetical protein JWL90_27 [Chthoniobacteraceae bacterium]|nr:hypothetical protein [Chthoniobacteraceae bacterium]